MAVSTSSYFSNSLVGQMQVGSDIDIYATDSTPKFAVGIGFTRADGNKYRYVQFGALVNRGVVVSKNGAETNQGSILQAGATVANTTRRANENIDPNAVGARYAQLVITATANQFAGAYLNITSGTGFGFTYRVKSNTATSAGNPVTGNIYVDLYDSIKVALDSNTALQVVGSPYADVMTANTSTVACMAVAGVSVTNATNTTYGWVCTRGQTAVLQDANIGTVGKPVALSTNTAGAILVIGSSVTTSGLATAQIGYLAEPGSSGSYSTVFLTLE